MTPRRKAALAVALWPLAITAAALAASFSMMDSLPEMVATHWGTGGVADDFRARESAPWFTLIGLFMGWAIGALVLALGGRDGVHRRIGVGIAAGIAVFMGAVTVSTLWIQRGLGDGREVGGADVAVTVAVLVALGFGTVAALTVPGPATDVTRATEPVPGDAPRAAGGFGQGAVWRGTAAPSRGIGVLFVVITVMFVGLAALADLWLFMLVMGVLVVGLGLGLSAFRVRVDSDGLVIRGLLGLPTWRVPLTDVAQARTTSVKPLSEFGGWGYRLGLDGRTGFVVRAGEALEVTRGDGSRWVVTVEDAERAAALLNTLADHERSTR